jgi:hypothetical protein
MLWRFGQSRTTVKTATAAPPKPLPEGALPEPVFRLKMERAVISWILVGATWLDVSRLSHDCDFVIAWG